MWRHRGFTLLELMVVLVLIGIMTTLAIISMGSGGLNRQLEQEGRRFISLVELAGDEAILQGRELGMDFSQTEYRFLTLIEGKWQLYPDDNIFRNRTLPDTAFYKLFIEGLPVELSEQLEPIDNDEEQDEPTKPQLFILSSGERNMFELQLLTSNRSHYQINGDIFGELLMSKSDAEP